LPERSPLADRETDLQRAIAHIFKWYDTVIAGYERIRKAEMKDAKDSAIEMALARESMVIWRKKLEEATAGATYELAVLEANSVLDRSLRGEKAILAYQEESAEFLTELTAVWRTSYNRLAVKFEDVYEAAQRLAEPFNHVKNDVRVQLALSVEQ
jgi:hypothetical protein